MKDSEDKEIPQEETALVQKEKKDPISKFFTDLFTPKKSAKDKELTQEDTVLVQEEKKDPITKFLIDPLTEKKDFKNKELPQEDTALVKEEKKDPMAKFFTEPFAEIKNSIESLTVDKGEYSLNIKKKESSGWEKFKLFWKNFFDDIQDLNPRHRRFKKLYNKIKSVELKVSEIKEDTTQIRLDISEVATMIEQLMEGHEDLETYMKENLGSDWKVLKHSWKKCKKGDISKWEFAKIGLKKVGKKFAGIFMKV